MIFKIRMLISYLVLAAIIKMKSKFFWQYHADILKPAAKIFDAVPHNFYHYIGAARNQIIGAYRNVFVYSSANNSTTEVSVFDIITLLRISNFLKFRTISGPN